jgi:hypothetical protein
LALLKAFQAFMVVHKFDASKRVRRMSISGNNHMGGSPPIHPLSRASAYQPHGEGQIRDEIARLAASGYPTTVRHDLDKKVSAILQFQGRPSNNPTLNFDPTPSFHDLAVTLRNLFAALESTKQSLNLDEIEQLASEVLETLPRIVRDKRQPVPRQYPELLSSLEDVESLATEIREIFDQVRIPGMQLQREFADTGKEITSSNALTVEDRLFYCHYTSLMNFSRSYSAPLAQSPISQDRALSSIVGLSLALADDYLHEKDVDRNLPQEVLNEIREVTEDIGSHGGNLESFPYAACQEVQNFVQFLATRITRHIPPSQKLKNALSVKTPAAVINAPEGIKSVLESKL